MTTAEHSQEGGAVGGVSTSTAGTAPGPRSLDSTAFGQDLMNSIQSISQPVEMSNLSTAPSVPDPPISSGQQGAAATKVRDGQNAEAKTQSSTTNAPVPQSALLAASEAPETSDSAIGPATDKPTGTTTADVSKVLVITLLLHSTETRHPYIIDESYLKRRNVNVEDNNPINMSVYNLKELILRDWRSEWEQKPNSPTSVRLIHMGRMLDDKSYLKESRFTNSDTPHIVHMTIKPQEAVDEEDARIAKGGNRDRDGNERSPGCRCMLM